MWRRLRLLILFSFNSLIFPFFFVDQVRIHDLLGIEGAQSNCGVYLSVFFISLKL